MVACACNPHNWEVGEEGLSNLVEPGLFSELGGYMVRCCLKKEQRTRNQRKRRGEGKGHEWVGISRKQIMTFLLFSKNLLTVLGQSQRLDQVGESGPAKVPWVFVTVGSANKAQQRGGKIPVSHPSEGHYRCSLVAIQSTKSRPCERKYILAPRSLVYCSK